MAKVTKTPSTQESGRGDLMPSGAFGGDLDRMFDDFFAMSPFRWLTSPEWALGKWGTSVSGAFHRADILDKGDAYEIDVEVPGMVEKDLDLALSDGFLTVSGQSTQEEEQRAEGRYLSERSYGAFSRRFRLPENIDTDKIDASLENGLLKIVLPKTADVASQEKKIAIKHRH